MNLIKYYGLKRLFEKNGEEILKASSASFREGIYIDGEFTLIFENKLAEYCNRKYAVSLGSGTDSLFLSLLSLGIKKGDEILVPAISFIATATAITRAGATPVFVDVCSGNALINLNDAKDKITNKTKALLYVDLYGSLPEFIEIESFSSNHNLLLIEDAAQSFGSNRNGQIAGSMGDISILSFDPTKPIGAFGTGGAILTNDKTLADYCYSARQNGKNIQNGQYDQFGINSRISELQASLLLWQFEKFKEQLNIRHFLSKHYLNGLKNLPIKIMVQEQFNYTGNFHKFVIKLNNRDELQTFLKTRGIETRIHYSQCLYEHPVLKKPSNPCINSEKLTHEVLSLPFYPELTIPEINYIIDSIKEFFKK
jgi:dTDP-4-amino-4,6-dideoxygalactose transaminase